MAPSTQASRLEIRLLGDAEVVVDGQARALPASKKTRALLGYLVTTRRPQRRERLCELLWEGPDDPRAGLRWSLAKLRPLCDLGGTRIVADRERVGFEPGSAEVDVLAVRALEAQGLGQASTQALSAAAALFRGPFLEGLELSSCPAFHAWCVAEREALRALQVRLLMALIGRHQAEPARALVHARSLVGLDPLAESPRLLLLDVLAAMGERRRALDEYEDYARTLRRELGVRPSLQLEQRRMALVGAAPGGAPAGPPRVRAAASAAEGTAPASRLAAGPAGAAVAPGAAAGRAGAGAPRLPPELVGRHAERLELERLLDAAAPKTPALLVLGEPGIGKSRLLEELGRRARERGGRALVGRAFEAELVRPYGAFIDALREPLTVGGKAPALPAPFAQPAADRSRLYDAVLAELVRLAAPAPPLVLLLDDLHWFDEASAELFFFLARALAGSPVLLATSARPGELADNPAAQRLLRALGREQLVTRLELGPLAASELEALVGPAARGEALARALSESAGNPLFALEAARAIEAGSQDLVGSLGQLISERLGRLLDDDRGVLSWAAALGRSFDAGVLATVTGLGTAELLACLERLERHAILRGRDSGSYDFSHDLLRQAAYRQMSSPRRRLVHAQVARALSVIPDPEGATAADVAHHAALGGDAALAARACISAGRRCLRLFAAREAIDLARRGRSLASALPAVEQLPLAVELLAIEIVAEPRPKQEEALVAIAEGARSLGLAAVEARAHFLKSVIHFRADEPQAALESAMSRLQASRHAGPQELARELAGAARCCLLLGKNLDAAVHLLARARALIGDGEDLDVVWAEGLLATSRGELDTAAGRLARTLELARRRHSHWEACECLLELALLELDRRDLCAALGHAEQLREVAGKLGDGAYGPAATCLQALVAARERCDDDELERHLPALRAAGGNRLLARLLNRSAEAALDAGRLELARRHASEALAAAERVERVNEAAWARLTLAELARRSGDAHGARRQLEALSAPLLSPDLSPRWARAIAEAWQRLGDGPRAASRARARARREFRASAKRGILPR